MTTYMHYTMHKMENSWICTHAFMVHGRMTNLVLKPGIHGALRYPKATFQLPVRREG